MMNFWRFDGPPKREDSDRHVENTSTTDTHDGGAASRTDSVDDSRYRVISIEAARTPEGCVGSDWHEYRIAQGENGITGYRRGDRARVSADVEAIVSGLNERRQWAERKAASKTRSRRAVARHVSVK
jgi:hypothetical protein